MAAKALCPREMRKLRSCGVALMLGHAPRPRLVVPPRRHSLGRARGVVRGLPAGRDDGLRQRQEQERVVRVVPRGPRRVACRSEVSHGHPERGRLVAPRPEVKLRNHLPHTRQRELGLQQGETQ